MAACPVAANESVIGLIGFASNGTQNPDAFVLLNFADAERQVRVTVLGGQGEIFQAYRSSLAERNAPIGSIAARDGVIAFTAPAKSATPLLTTDGII